MAPTRVATRVERLEASAQIALSTGAPPPVRPTELREHTRTGLVSSGAQASYTYMPSSRRRAVPRLEAMPSSRVSGPTPCSHVPRSPGVGRARMHASSPQRLLVILSVVSSALVVPARIVSADEDRPNAALVDARLAPVKPRLEAALAAAKGGGLPPEWLADKVNEGLAKHVDATRIAAAVEQLLERMRVGARTLRGISPRAAPGRDKALLRAIVDALAVGAPEPALAGLGRAIADSGGGPGSAQRGVATVAELGERGFDGAAAVEAVRLAFEHGGPSAWTALLARADAIPSGAPQARSDALRAVAERLGLEPGAHGIQRADDRTRRPSTPPGPPHDTSFSRGRGPSALRRGPQQ